MIYAGERTVPTRKPMTVPASGQSVPADADTARTDGPVYRLNEALAEGPRSSTPPFKELAAVSLGIGHNRMVLDDDGPLRRVVPFLRPSTQGARRRGAAAR